MRARSWVALAAVAAAGAAVMCAAPRPARAFCGFYVSGANATLYNNATMVVMMRDGTRTVLSMQNNYQGPPQDFAMVVPVPVVLEKDDVKTLPPDVFDRVDQLASPRLVEYWEQDPCHPNQVPTPDMVVMDESMPGAAAGSDRDDDLGVKVEARFAVGEYQVVILSAKDSTGLDTWLHQENYHIPAGAEPLLRPYVAQGMKFFVAKVDIKKVHMSGGQATLSPLRFYYDSSQFNLPVRLGMINSHGTQDLIIHILSPGQRYEVANYDNVTIPTNLDVSDDTRGSFPAFYAALFDRTAAAHEGAVVTEYSWDAGSCDPCPTPPLSPDDIATLGGDVVEHGQSGFVLTRLHARYGAGSLGDDLVFRAAPPIVGGRESVAAGPDGGLERGARPDSSNNFQARYIIRHPWTGPVACEHPQRGVWGGPPGGGNPQPVVKPALHIATAARGAKLGHYLKEDLAPADFKVSRGDGTAHFKPSGIQRKGCGGCDTSSGTGAGLLALLAAVLIGLGLGRRRSGA